MSSEPTDVSKEPALKPAEPAAPLKLSEPVVDMATGVRLLAAFLASALRNRDR
jgi:hypothetical protein